MSDMHDPYDDQLRAARYRAERDQAREELERANRRICEMEAELCRLRKAVKRPDSRKRQIEFDRYTNLPLGSNWSGEWPEYVLVHHEGAVDDRRYVPDWACDREALLALADELDAEGLNGWSGTINVGELARRIREACGEVM